MDLREAIEEMHNASFANNNSEDGSHQDLHEYQQETEDEQTTPSKANKVDLKSSGYARVIEDLRDKGIALEDLATEILRLTSIGDDGSEYEEELGTSSDSPTTSNRNLSVEKGNQGKTEDKQTDSVHAVRVQPAPKTLLAKQDGANPRPKEGSLSFSAKGSGGAHQKQPYTEHRVARLRKSSTPTVNPEPTLVSDCSDHQTNMTHMESYESQVPTPTQLQRNQTSSFPGAYSVCPSLQQTESTTDIDVESALDDSQSMAVLDTGRDPEAPDPPSPRPADPTPSHSNGDTDALEAVRVDDIMTVKAEPMTETNNSLYKVIACVACALVIMVLALSLALTANKDKDATLQEETTPSPTYDPDTRVQLLQEILLQDFAPLYDQNYNTTNGTLVLQDAFLTDTTPQHKALQWIARDDPELQVITRPFLQDFPNDDHRDTNDLSLFGEDTTTSHDGGARLLQETSISRHRISQRYALAVLFFSTGNWTDKFEFLSPGHECDWSGALQCSDDFAITHLDLRNNELQGTIPLELAVLTRLQSLNLASNALVGTLPPSLQALSQLTLLDLGFNKLSGTIPDVYYQNWHNLELWSLAESDLTGTVSSYIGNLERLKTIAWQRNELHGSLPSAFWAKLTNMESLDLSQQGGKFVNDTIGTEIGMWSNLRNLIYHGLELRGTIPSQLGKLTLLDRLQIASNHLSGTIPSELGALTAVTRLSLSLNAITGTVPEEFVHLTSLTRLYLQNTLLSGDVSFLCDAIDQGKLLPMDPMRVDMGEVSGCRCCTCCLY